MELANFNFSVVLFYYYNKNIYSTNIYIFIWIIFKLYKIYTHVFTDDVENIPKIITIHTKILSSTFFFFIQLKSISRSDLIHFDEDHN